MRAAIIENGICINVTDSETLIHPDGLMMAQSDVAQIGDLWDGSQFSRLPGPSLADLKAASILKIDADADKIYGEVVGNKGEEYRSAEADAKAFVAAGYLGVAGSGVTSWATAKGWTTTQAANDIIAQATAWRGAQALIRAQRLSKKEAIKAATDSATIDLLMAQWAAFVAGIRTQLGVS